MLWVKAGGIYHQSGCGDWEGRGKERVAVTRSGQSLGPAWRQVRTLLCPLSFLLGVGMVGREGEQGVTALGQRGQNMPRARGEGGQS